MSQAPPVRVGHKIHGELAELQDELSRERGRRVSLAEVIERALAALRQQRADENPVPLPCCGTLLAYSHRDGCAEQ